MPFHTLRGVHISRKIIQGHRPTILINADDFGISDGLRQLLTRCWDANYTKHPQINEVLRHLCQESALESIFPPSRLPRPRYESLSESGKRIYGNCLRFGPYYTCAHQYTVGTRSGANAKTLTEGIVDATFSPVKLTSSLFNLPCSIPASPLDTSTFIGSSPAGSFKSFESEDPTQSHDVVEAFANAECQPSPEHIHNQNEGGYTWHPE